MTARSATILLTVLLAGAALTLGCRGRNVRPVDANELLTAAATRMEQPGPFHFDLAIERGSVALGNGLQMTAASGDVASSDRMKMRVRARAGPLDVDLGIVTLPEGSYITNPLTGRWEADRLNADAFFAPSTGMPALMRAASDARVTGTEKIGDVATYRVEAKVDSGALQLLAPGAVPGRPLTARVWIGVDTPFVYRLEVVGAASEGEAADVTRRLELSQFGVVPDISAPPVGGR